MADEDTDKDSISELPDAILNIILSLVPTKSVIAVASLSRRWRRVSAEYFAYNSNLSFGEDFARKQTPDQFIENLNKILGMNKSEKIDRFQLVFSPRNDQHKANATKWIKFATSRGVREVELDFCRQIHMHFLSRAHIINGNEAFELPGFLFDCKSLTTVKISRCILALPENYIGFSGISTLYLKEVYITDEMLENLVSNCKLLEVLALKECGSLSRIRIMSPVNLKRLTVYECYNASKIEITGPNIRSLLVSCGHLDSCKLENMSLLEDVFLGTRGDEFGGAMYIFMKILSDLAHVRSMTLYFGHLVPSLFKDFQVKLSNLQELVLVNSPLFGLFNTDVYCFFRHCSCPSLKKITIENNLTLSMVELVCEELWLAHLLHERVVHASDTTHHVTVHLLSELWKYCKPLLRNLSTVSEEDNFIWEYRKPNVEPVECVFDNLRAITLLNFRGTNSDIDLARFFLTRSPILESMLLVTARKLNVPCPSSSREASFKGMQEDLCGLFECHPQASPTAHVRIISESIEHNTLSSIFKWHNVFDVYNK